MTYAYLQQISVMLDILWFTTPVQVLAALDVHTAQWIVENCLKGDLVQGRTVILVVCLVPADANILLNRHLTDTQRSTSKPNC